MTEELRELYYDPEIGLTSATKFYKRLKNLGYKYTYAQIRKFVSEQESDQVMRTRNVHTSFPISSHSAAERIEIDLLDLSNFSKWNSNYKFVLVAIDVYTKVVFVQAIKSKNDKDVYEAFKRILEEILKTFGCYPLKLYSDKESSFMSKQFRNLCTKLDISQIFVEDENEQCYVVEHMNRMIRLMLHRYFVSYNTKKYIDVLQQLIEGYNQRYNRAIHATPYQAIQDNTKYEEAMKLQREEASRESIHKGYADSNLNVNDRVRLKIKRKTLEKRTDIVWTKTVYKITDISHNLYSISDHVHPYKAQDLQKVDIVSTRPEHVDDHGVLEAEVAREKKDRRTSRRIRKEGIDTENIEKDPEARNLRKYRKKADHGFMIQQED